MSTTIGARIKSLREQRRLSQEDLAEQFGFKDRQTLSAIETGDRKVADQMSSYYVNFARSGNPNGRGLPKWQPHRAGASERAIILDATPKSEQLPSRARLELVDKLYAQMRSAAQ